MQWSDGEGAPRLLAGVRILDLICVVSSAFCTMPDGTPTKVGTSIADLVTGLYEAEVMHDWLETLP